MTYNDARADSLATNISQVYDQVKTASLNQIELLTGDITSGEIKVLEKITQIEQDLNNPTTKNCQKMDVRLLGLKSKIETIKPQEKKVRTAKEYR